MRKLLLVAAIFCFLLPEIGHSQVRYGARASGSMTNITIVHSISKSRVGYQLGGFALIPIGNNDIVFFQPEVNYSAQGEYNMHPREDKSRLKQKVFLSYINVPLNAKAYVSDAVSDFFVELGPYLGFKVGENVESYDFGTEPDDEEFNSFDFGVNLGVGFSFNRKVELSARYSYGLVDMVENDTKDAVNHTSILNFGVSYIFQ